MKEKLTPANYRYEPSNTTDIVNPKKVSSSKVCEYIRAAYIDGKKFIQAYAEAVDPNIYNVAYGYRYKIKDQLEARPDFEELKSMVMKEDQDEMLRRSATLQHKAQALLLDTMDSASKALQDNGNDPKTLQAAAGVLKTLMPAFQAINAKVDESNSSEARKHARAVRVLRRNQIEG